MRKKQKSGKGAGFGPRSLRSFFKEADAELQKGDGIPHDEFWREVEKARQDKRPPSSRRKKA
jgi:hypothetical protein